MYMNKQVYVDLTFHVGFSDSLVSILLSLDTLFGSHFGKCITALRQQPEELLVPLFVRRVLPNNRLITMALVCNRFKLPPPLHSMLHLVNCRGFVNGYC